MKTVPLTIFWKGNPEHTCQAEVIADDKETITVKMVGSLGRFWHNTYCKKTGLFLSGKYGHLPQFVFMAAEKPIKDSFAHEQYKPFPL